jgi:hypothetical protein
VFALVATLVPTIRGSTSRAHPAIPTIPAYPTRHAVATHPVCRASSNATTPPHMRGRRGSPFGTQSPVGPADAIDGRGRGLTRRLPEPTLTQ